jgi:hypothetical protein
LVFVEELLKTVRIVERILKMTVKKRKKNFVADLWIILKIMELINKNILKLNK